MLLPRIRDILGADTCAVLLLDEETDELVARAAVGIEEEVEAGVRIPVGGGFAGRVAAGKRPIVLDDIDEAEVLNPILREKGIKSMLGVPLLVAGAVIGVLHVGTLHRREFGDDDVDLLQLAADRAAMAIEHARLFEAERRRGDAGRARAGRHRRRARALELDELLEFSCGGSATSSSPTRARCCSSTRDGRARRPGAVGNRRGGRRGRARSRWAAASPAASPHEAAGDPRRRRRRPTSSTRSCARRGSSRCSACRCRSATSVIGVLHVGTLVRRFFTRGRRGAAAARRRAGRARDRACAASRGDACSSTS